LERLGEGGEEAEGRERRKTEGGRGREEEREKGMEELKYTNRQGILVVTDVLKEGGVGLFLSVSDIPLEENWPTHCCRLFKCHTARVFRKLH